MENTNRVNSLKIHMKESGETYELDYNRDSVRFAEAREFVPEDVPKFPQTKVEELWFYAFRWHHKGMSRTQTDALLKKVGGVTPKMLERLLLLYSQAQMSNSIQDDEDLEKNASVAVEF